MSRRMGKQPNSKLNKVCLECQLELSSPEHSKTQINSWSDKFKVKALIDYSKDGTLCSTMLRLLLEAKVNIDGPKPSRMFGNTHNALHWAADQGHVDIVEMLLDHKANVNAVSLDNETALHEACKRNQYKCVELLLARKANVNTKTNHLQYTALHFAAANSACESTELLLKHPNINIEAKDQNMWTPLTVASMTWTTNAPVLLMDAKADIWYDENGLDPAVIGLLNLEEPEITDRLIQPHHYSNEGFSPLMMAVLIDDDTDASKVSSMLLAGADVDHEDRYGMCALSIALMSGNVLGAIWITKFKKNFTFADLGKWSVYAKSPSALIFTQDEFQSMFKDAKTYTDIVFRNLVDEFEQSTELST